MSPVVPGIMDRDRGGKRGGGRGRVAACLQAPRGSGPGQRRATNIPTPPPGYPPDAWANHLSGDRSRHDPLQTRKRLLEKLDALGGEVVELAMDAREPPAGLAVTLDEADAHKIGPRVEHDRHPGRRPLGRERD